MIDYNWIFSALVQSLAAMIGVIGMFAVYRLQTQEKIIEKKFEKFRIFLEENTGTKIDNPTEERIIEKAKGVRQKYQKIINDSPNNLNVMKNTQGFTDSAMEQASSIADVGIEIFKKHTIDIDNFNASIEQHKNKNKDISKQALDIVGQLVFLFGLSVLVLIFSKVLTVTNTELFEPGTMTVVYGGLVVLTIVSIYLVILLRTIYVFCNTCFSVK
ncbi:MAG: hypothetical protein GY858_09505 [Candidatus Omnitrophica bacterium]|nr:hypothetical protein [Candidatus Omnitrophota bacterium]